MGESETAKCRKCASEISTEANKCPECGYEPSSQGSTGRSVMMVFGLILTGTIIGGLIGIPLLYLGYKSREYHQDMKPTTTDPDDTISVKELIQY